MTIKNEDINLYFLQPLNLKLIHTVVGLPVLQQITYILITKVNAYPVMLSTIGKSIWNSFTSGNIGQLTLH